MHLLCIFYRKKIFIVLSSEGILTFIMCGLLHFYFDYIFKIYKKEGDKKIDSTNMCELKLRLCHRNN